MAEEIERIYVIPLRKQGFKHSVAAPTAVKRVKLFLTKHMKVDRDNIWIDDSLNHSLWSHGKYKMPNKIRVKVVKFDDGVVEAYLPELEYKKSRRELLKEEKAKKEPILRKEIPEAEGPTEEGEEGYEIAPAADGEVKIKKKKPAKPKEDKEIEKKPAKPKEKKEVEKKPKEISKKSKKTESDKKPEIEGTKKKQPKATPKKKTEKKTQEKQADSKKSPKQKT